MSRVAATLWMAVVILGAARCGSRAEQSGVPTAPTAPAAPPAFVSAPLTFIGYVADVTLSGVVFEKTAAGPQPLEGVTVYCDACGEHGHSGATTDRRGFYTFTGIWLSVNPLPLHIEKEGYDDPPDLPVLEGVHRPKGPGWREVTVAVAGHTRFDMDLIRRP